MRTKKKAPNRPACVSRRKRPESVLIVVYTESGEVLLLRRREPDYFWQSVAGSLEWGETPVQAAVRELAEETGLPGGGLMDCGVVSRYVIYPMWRCRYAPGVVENTERVFRLALTRPRDIKLDPREHIEYRWLAASEALAKASSHTNRTAIERWVIRMHPDRIG